MKSVLIALTTAAALSAAAPALAASATQGRYTDSAVQPYQTAALSEHCQQVLSRPDMWGGKEVTFCQNSL